MSFLPPHPQSEMDAFFMREALKEAKKAFRAEEVPVGAVVVREGRIVARGYNQVELLKDATAHAEMLCMTSASHGVGNWRLLGMTLYCTLEPCAMCAGAMLLSRVKELVWGAPDIRQGAGGSWTDLFGLQHPCHRIEVRARVLEEECAALMREFFRLQREKKGLQLPDP